MARDCTTFRTVCQARTDAKAILDGVITGGMVNLFKLVFCRNLDMRILIVGAGRMGFSLAQRLDEERHDITVIDPDAANTECVRTRLDVMAVNGSGSSLRDLREAGAEKTDLLIAASGSDEVNIISCLLGRQLGIPKRMARVESDALLEDLAQIDQEVLGVSEFVNPARVAVNRLQHMILTPGTTESAEFAGGAIVLRALRLESGAPLTKAPLSDIHNQLDIEFRVVAVRGARIWRYPRATTSRTRRTWSTSCCEPSTCKAFSPWFAPTASASTASFFSALTTSAFLSQNASKTKSTMCC